MYWDLLNWHSSIHLDIAKAMPAPSVGIIPPLTGLTSHSKFCARIQFSISHANTMMSHVATIVSLWVCTHKADIITRPNHHNRCVSSKQKPQKCGQSSAGEAITVPSNWSRAPIPMLETLQLHTSLTSKQQCPLHLVRSSRVATLPGM